MLWCFTLIVVLTIFAVTLNEPGRWRGWPAERSSAARPAETASNGPPKPGTSVRTDRMTVSCWSNGQHRLWKISYLAEDGHIYLFHFGEEEFTRVQQEFRAMCDDPELGWNKADERFVRDALMMSLYRILSREKTRQQKQKHDHESHECE